MKQNLILIAALIILTFTIKHTIDYPTVQIAAASIWCFTLFWLLKNVIEGRVKRKQNS